MMLDALFAPRAQVTVDDGGVRCVTKRGGRYVPFVTLADATVTIGAFGRATLRLVDRELRATTLRVGAGEALELQAEVLRGLHAVAVTGAGRDESALAPLARGGRALLDWLASAVEAARSGYRSAALDPEAARACLVDVAAPPDLRAACAHALLATAREEELAAVARAFVARALPPLVVVAARLGRGGAALVPDAMCEDALAVLASEDVAAVRGAMDSPAPHEDEAHVHELMERVKAEALRAAAKERPAPPHRRRAVAHALGGYAGQQGVTRFK